jgi:hypothetical protein
LGIQLHEQYACPPTFAPVVADHLIVSSVGSTLTYFVH